MNASGQAIVEWAVEALRVEDSPSLRILAGLCAPWNELEIDRYLTSAARELDVRLPAPDELPGMYAGEIADEIVSGRRSPLDGVSTMHALYLALGEPEWLEDWKWLDDALALAQQRVAGTVPEVETAIVAEARILSASCRSRPG
jgi:hypothetical protein